MANVVLAILGISLLMIVHEGGHYLMARANGMRVDTFSIGFGPALFKFKPKGSPTTFQLCVVPLLAYVRIAGTNPGEKNDPEDTGLYENKSVWARMLAIFGGPLANYLFASIVVFGLAMSGWREQVPSTPIRVAKVEAGSPAAIAGVHVGDRLVEVEGHSVSTLAEMKAITNDRAGVSTAIVVERSGARLPLSVTPKKVGERTTIGFTPGSDTVVRHVSAGQAAVMAVQMPFKLTVQSVESLSDLVRRRSTEGLTGPVGMTKAMAKEAEAGPYAFFALLFSISVAIGFFNLLPMPFLDGGKLLFLGFEAITGKRAHRTAEALVHAAGMVALLLAAAAVTFRDLVG